MYRREDGTWGRSHESCSLMTLAAIQASLKMPHISRAIRHIGVGRRGWSSIQCGYRFAPEYSIRIQGQRYNLMGWDSIGGNTHRPDKYEWGGIWGVPACENIPHEKSPKIIKVIWNV